MIIDAHQHFWKLSRGDYGFPSKDDPLLYRDFLPDDLQGHLAGAGVTSTIAVQATETIAETEFLLALARTTPFLAGVVGWCNLRDGASAATHLDALSGMGPLVGIRPMLQAHDDASWLLSAETHPAIDALIERELTFDALVDARHLNIIDAFAARHPDLRIVLNHLAKPWRDLSLLQEWRSGMEQLARRSNCWVKVSGLPTADVSTPHDISAVSLIRFAADRFGADRMIWGSDWPVSNRNGTYNDSLSRVWNEAAAEERTKIFHETAITAYRLPA